MSVERKKIRIVSPSGAIDPADIRDAVPVLEDWGYEVSVGNCADESYGRFAGTDASRIADLQEALNDESLFAVLCSRGGYGLARIIDKIDFTPMLVNYKWLIGFSDVTVIHNALSALGLRSLHAPMVKYLTEFSPDSVSLSELRAILDGEMPVYKIPASAGNRPGMAKGKLTGGNLSVFMGLRGTPYDLDFDGAVLFMEDVGEKPYHIDRMMQNLRLSGKLEKLSGLVVGHFTDCPEDPLMKRTIREIISDAVADYDFPVCFGFPAGHEFENYPLIMGAEVSLVVDAPGTTLAFS